MYTHAVCTKGRAEEEMRVFEVTYSYTGLPRDDRVYIAGLIIDASIRGASSGVYPITLLYVMNPACTYNKIAIESASFAFAKVKIASEI